MRGLIKGVAIVLAVAAGQATAAPVIDGTFDGTEVWTLIGSGTPQQNFGPDVMPAGDLYFAEDGEYIYLAATKLNDNTWSSFGFIIDQGDAGGTSDNPWGYSFVYNHATLPDVVLHGMWHVGSVGHYSPPPYAAELHVWDGSSLNVVVEDAGSGPDQNRFSFGDVAVGPDPVGDNANYVEIRIAKSRFSNLGSSINVQFYMTGDQAAHGIFDSIPDDDYAHTFNMAGTPNVLENYINVPITLAPSAPSTPALNPADDSGISDSDGITNVTMPEFTGTADTDTTVTLSSSLDGSLGSVFTADGNWSITPQDPLSEGQHEMTAFASIGPGFDSPPSDPLTITIDTEAPEVDSEDPAASSLLTGLTQIEITFGETVHGVAANDLEVNNTSASSVSGSGAGPYTFTVTDPGDGIANVVLASGSITDTAGNAFAGASWSYTIDATPPAVETIVPTAGSTLASLTSIQVTFDEDVQNVAAADLTVNTVAATGVSGSGAGPYTFTVANPGDGPVDVVLAIGSITDLAGNPFAGDSWSYTIDTTQPSVVLTSVDVPNGGYANAPVSFTATFSEAVSGFDDGDISVTNGAVDDFTAVTGSVYTFTIVPVAEEPVQVSVPDSVATAVAPPNNPNAASAAYSFTYDITPPTSEITSETEWLVVGTTVTLHFEASDTGSGVAQTALWVKQPGESSFADSGLTAPGTSGSFDYTASVNGVYEFHTIAADNAGNMEAPPAEADIAVVVNTVENGALTLDAPAGAQAILTFPMAPGIHVEITLSNLTTAGTLTVSRTLDNDGATAAGLNTDFLIGESWTIVAGGGLDFADATIVFVYDETLLGTLAEGDIDTAFRVEGTDFTAFPITVDPIENTITVTGVEQFSDWYAGSSDASATDVRDWHLLD